MITGSIVESAPPDTTPFRNPDNAHYYQLIVNSDITSTAAKTAAQNSTVNGANGTLVTIPSASEIDFVDNLIGDYAFKLWIGLTDKDTEGVYVWVTCETSSNTNWNTTQPDNHNNEDYDEFSSSNGKWNDLPDNYSNITGYIIEYAQDTDLIRNPTTGHYYEYITADNITWTAA